WERLKRLTRMGPCKLLFVVRPGSFPSPAARGTVGAVRELRMHACGMRASTYPGRGRAASTFHAFVANRRVAAGRTPNALAANGPVILHHAVGAVRVRAKR